MSIEATLDPEVRTMIFVEEIWKQLDPSRNAFVRRKLSIARKALRKDAENEKRSIYLANARNLNSAILPAKLLEANLQRIEGWADTVYSIYCEAWRLKGNEKSPELVWTIYTRVIRSLIAAGCNSAVADERRRTLSTGGDPMFESRVEAFENSVNDLLERWEDRAETEALEITARTPHAAVSSSAPTDVEAPQMVASASRSALESSIAGPKDPNRHKVGRGRPHDPLRQRRDEVIRRVAASGATGMEYCQRLSLAGLYTPMAWQKRDNCPKDYRDAYMHSALDRRKVFRNRIADEKYKATKKSTRQK